MYRPCTRDSATNLRCSKVSHHAFPLPSACLNQAHLPHPDLPPVTEMGLIGQLVQWCHGYFPCHLCQKHAGRSRHAVAPRVVSASAVAAGKYAWSALNRAIARSLATTARTMMMTGTRSVSAECPRKKTKNKKNLENSLLPPTLEANYS